MTADLRPQIYLPHFDLLLPDLDRALCGITEHTNDANSPFPSRVVREWVSHCLRWHGIRSLHREPDPSTHDDVYDFTLHWPFSRTRHRRLHQSIYNLVTRHPLQNQNLTYTLSLQALDILCPHNLVWHNAPRNILHPRNIPPRPPSPQSSLPTREYWKQKLLLRLRTRQRRKINPENNP